jgi:cell division protein FtsB
MNIIRHPFFRFTIIIVSSLVCFGLIRSIVGNIRRNDLVSERQAVLEREKERNMLLQEKLREATSASFLEKQAREKLGLVREGETIVLVGKPRAEESQSQGSSESLSLWKRWWRLFF